MTPHPPPSPATRPRWLWPAAGMGVALAVIVGLYLSRVFEPGDDGPPTPFEPARPFELTLSRGSTAVDAYYVDLLAEDGTVTRYEPVRLHEDELLGAVYRRATARLTDDERRRVAEAVVANRLPGLREQIWSRSGDPTRWCLALRQDGREKFVTCETRVPARLETFAQVLDDLFAGHTLQWQEVPSGDGQFNRDWARAHYPAGKR